MTLRRLSPVLALAFVTAVTSACQDVPLLPKWNADWNVPLPSQSISLAAAFSPLTTIPANTPANVAFGAQAIALDGAIGQLLRQPLSNASLIIVLSKSIPLDGADTVFVAQSPAELTAPTASTIVIPLSLVAANAKDSVQSPALTPANLTMLQNVAIAGTTLQVQMRGRVVYPGPGNRTITSTDSIGVKLQMLATVAVSR
jgi:hypothetical protein